VKVLTILGTRPEIIRLSSVIGALEDEPSIDHAIVHTGQNYDYELNQVFFEDLGVPEPLHYLDVSRDSVGKAYGDILSKSEEVLLAERPDAVLILGDTNSAISAIIAKRLHIPIFHMEAGNRSFDANVPEEVNRRVVDHVADFNLVYTEHARRNLLAEGLPARNVYLTGSPMNEVLSVHRHAIESSTATADLGLEPQSYFLVSAHREENVDHPDRLRALVESLYAIRDEFGKTILVSLHPRTRERLVDVSTDGIVLHAPFGFHDYNRLQLDAACVISDSGTISEESALLGLRAVSIRDSIERPEGLDHGTVILCGLEAQGVVSAVGAAMRLPRATVPASYEIADTSTRVLKLILGLTRQHRFWSGLHG